MKNKDIALYIHMPWCIKKCPYCDFNSHQLNNKLPEEEYIDNLLVDLKTDIEEFQIMPNITSIFIGGGTPSLISPKGYEYLFNEIQNICSINSDIEITMEANPGTVEHVDFKEYKAAGINRISLGVQSFSEEKLKILGRIHGKNECYNAINEVIDSGFDNFNIDIMHSLPGQTTQQALDDLSQAIKLNPSHISWYQLTLEPGTNFYYNPPNLPKEEIQADIFQEGTLLLQESNFNRYEISGFHRGKKCEHNLNYWRFGDYLGIGAGACGKISNTDTKVVIRTTKIRQPKFYMDPKHNKTSKLEMIDSNKIPFEFMLNILRLLEGFTKEQFESKTFQPFSCIEKITQQAIAEGLIQKEQGYFIPTPLGLKFHNELLEKFL